MTKSLSGVEELSAKFALFEIIKKEERKSEKRLLKSRIFFAAKKLKPKVIISLAKTIYQAQNIYNL